MGVGGPGQEKDQSEKEKVLRLGLMTVIKKVTEEEEIGEEEERE